MNAVIYVRVSSREQVEGTSLASQEAACREYARRHELNISRVFVEEGESAKFADRTRLLELLDFCKSKDHAISSLIVWKLDRFARNVEDHFAIKAMLRRCGVSVLSVTEPIAADPNGKLMETILAGFAAFDNDIRALRTCQGLQQRIREGLYPFQAPLGYLSTRSGKKTQPDRPDPARFEPLQKTWRLFASGAYSKASIVRLLRVWGVTTSRGRPISPQFLDHMFGNRYYAGQLRDPFTGEIHEGRHVPMISIEEFSEVQRLIGRPQTPTAHSRLNAAFPLRGLVRCPTCQHYMTGAFSRGCRRRYSYYSCFQRQCPTRTKSYPADRVHHEFETFLGDLSLPRSVAAATLAEVRRQIRLERELHTRASDAISRRLVEVDNQMHEIITMRASALVSESEFVVTRDNLRKQRDELQARLHPEEVPLFTPEDEASIVDVFSDIPSLWAESPIEIRRVFGDLILPAGFVFKELRTAQKGLLINVFQVKGGVESNVVDRAELGSNSLQAELRKLLELIRRTKESREAQSKAA